MSRLESTRKVARRVQRIECGKDWNGYAGTAGHRQMWQAGGASVLVTLVATDGSSYRQPGARLLLASSSEAYAGTISGGCLEAEVVRRAPWFIRNGAHVERYSMAFDDTSEIPFGLGCGGSVDLLFESTASPEAQALKQAMERSLQGHASRVVHFLPDANRPLRRLIVGADDEVLFQSEGLSEKKVSCARELEPGVYEGRFVERLGPPQRLLIFGAGDDARPLVSFAAQLGWTVLVVDGRAQLARAERFPLADQVFAQRELKSLNAGSSDVMVLMTHSYEQDRDWLQQVLPLQPIYLGLLGSRHRSSLLVSEAAAFLGWELSRCCDPVYAPVGMDLGGEGAEAIALAIVAEAQAVTHGKLGKSRRLSPADIAHSLQQGGSSLYLQTQCALG